MAGRMLIAAVVLVLLYIFIDRRRLNIVSSMKYYIHEFHGESEFESERV